MKCGNCGQELTSGDVFCSNCGAKLIRKKTKKEVKYSIGRAFLESFIIALIVFIIPVMTSIICTLGNIDLDNNYKEFLLVIQFTLPTLILLIVPVILYSIKNK